MKLALLIYAPAHLIKESAVSFIGAGRFKLNVGGFLGKITAHIQPPGIEIQQGEEFEGPCEIKLNIVEGLNERISVYAEQV